MNMINLEDDSMLNNMNTILGQICGTELIETSIKDATNKKKTIVSKIDSVTNLMKEVEYQEKEAEQSKVEAAQIHSAIMLKVYELMDKQQHVKKKNDMLAGEAYVQKKLLSAKIEALQLNVTSLLDKGDRSIALLDEMSKSLETRLASAVMRIKLAIKKKKESEEFALAALANEEIQMGKVEEESKRLKQEAMEISKLQEFLIDREHLVAVLHGEISEKCQDVKQLKEELDQVIEFSEADLKSSPAVAHITIKKVKIKGKSRGYRLFAKCIKKVKIKGKLHRNEMFAKRIKTVNMKSKLHGYQICAKSIKKLNPKGKSQICAKITKKLKIKGILYGSQMHAKTINNLAIKGKAHGNQICAKNFKIEGIRHGSQMCPKNIKNFKIKGRLHGNQICAKSIKKLMIKGKRHGSQMYAKNIKNLKIEGKLRESRMYVNSITKMKINSKRRESHLCPKSIKKRKLEGKQQGGHISNKKVKIKGLQVVKKGGQLQIRDARRLS